VPPTTDGLLHDVDVRRLAEFRARLDAIFATDLSAGASASAIAGRSDGGGPAAVLDADPDTYWAAPDDAPQPWVEVDLGRPVTFDTVVLQEAIQLGQRVESYRLQCWDGARLVTVARGTTIGHKKLDRFAPVTARRVRLTIDAAMAAARIGRLALYRTPPDA
jgi:alpha-L-fucosidase